ncbi:MAG TPA: hypothetical protein VLB29_17600 [Nocardioidaceae bacterium]|nr:hypothetical protein [Nocardioidaceae bacterium]
MTGVALLCGAYFDVGSANMDPLLLEEARARLPTQGRRVAAVAP